MTVDEFYEDWQKLRKENENLKGENEKLKEALEFYADKNNWVKDRHETPTYMSVISPRDLEETKRKKIIGGKLARQVLKEVNDEMDTIFNLLEGK